MKVCICCSLTFTDEVNEIAKMLNSLGHEVLLPNGVIGRIAEQPGFDPVRAKIETDSGHAHIEKIRECDAVLMCNFLKDCIPGYIGANSFTELAAAYYFNKPIYALFDLPDLSYINDEIQSFGIQVINNDLTRLPNAGYYNSAAPVSQTRSEVESNRNSIRESVLRQDNEPARVMEQAAELAPEPVVVAENQATLNIPRPEEVSATATNNTSSRDPQDDPRIDNTPEIILPPAPTVITNNSAAGSTANKPENTEAANSANSTNEAPAPEPWYPWSFLKRK